MALDPTLGDAGRIHVVWLHTLVPAPTGGLPAPPNPILAAFSDNGGRSFSRPVQVNDSDRKLSVAPAIAVRADHALQVLYYDLGDDRPDYQGLEGPTWTGSWSLISTTSTDGGRRFRRGAVVDDRLRPPERVLLIYTMPPPALAADRSGRLFAAWYDGRNGDWDVFLRSSSDAGRSWQRPVRLNDDRVGDGRHQYQPRLSIAPNGRVDAIFYDRRRDPKNLHNDLSYTYSTDGGRSFAPNTRLNTASSDTRSGQRYLVPSARGLVEFGSRVALLSRESGALAAWTDTRNTVGTAGQDIFTTDVPSPRAGARATTRPRVPTAAGSGDRGIPMVLLLLGLVLSVAALWTLRRQLRRPRPAALRWGLAALALVPVASCGEASKVAPLPSAPPVVDISMREYRYEHQRLVSPGRAVFRAHNRGRKPHEIVLLELPKDFPPIDKQLHGKTRRPVATLAHLHPLMPGQSDAFAVDLAPGRYAMVDFVKNRGVLNALKGMNSEFHVR